MQYRSGLAALAVLGVCVLSGCGGYSTEVHETYTPPPGSGNESSAAQTTPHASSAASASQYHCPPYAERTHEDGNVYTGKTCTDGRELWVVLYYGTDDTYRYLNANPAQLTGVEKTYWSATLPSAAPGTARIAYLIGGAKCQLELAKGKHKQDGTITVTSSGIPDCTQLGSN